MIKKILFMNYEGKDYRLTKKNNPNKFPSYNTLIQNYGTQFVRDVLGIISPEIPPEQRKELLKIDKTIASTKSSPELEESIEMQTVEQVQANIKNFLETSTQTELALGPEGSLPYRELAGLDRSLRNMRTTVLKITSDREAKKATLRQLKDELKDELNNVLNVEDDSLLREKQEEIETLEEEIEVLDSVIREYDGKFRSQFQRINQTIDKMLNQDMTLGERIQTLFREQGLTIASVNGILSAA